MPKPLRLRAFAKVNLCLHVLGKRSDGYHELRTIFQAISLHDTLEMEIAPRQGVFLESSDASLPSGPENLVWRAIEAAQRELKFRYGIRAKLTKRIPIARGLGGGSSDAATALAGMIRLSKRQITPDRLIEIAASLGADVPFFLFGGRAAAVNRGDEIYPLADGPRQTILIVSPESIGVSTREAYAWLDRKLTKSPASHRIFGFCALCWSRQNSLSNDFEAAVFCRHSRLAQIKRALLRGGAAEAALAGSGSAVFGIFRNPAQARRAARAFPKDQVFVTQTLTRESYLRASGIPRFLGIS